MFFLTFKEELYLIWKVRGIGGNCKDLVVQFEDRDEEAEIGQIT